MQLTCGSGFIDNNNKYIPDKAVARQCASLHLPPSLSLLQDKKCLNISKPDTIAPFTASYRI